MLVNAAVVANVASTAPHSLPRVWWMLVYRIWMWFYEAVPVWRSLQPGSSNQPPRFEAPTATATATETTT